MLKAINGWAAPEEKTFEEIFHDFSSAGFQGVELNFETEGSSAHALTLSTTDQELMQIRQAAEHEGIKLTSICAALLGSSLGHPDRTRNEWGMQAVRHQLHMAQVLGCRSILIYTSGFSHHSLQDTYKRALDVMRELKPEIEAQSVLVGLENADQFFQSPFDYAKFIDDIGSNKIGAYLDFANVAIFQYPYPEHWLDILGERVISVHIKDYKNLGLGMGLFVPLLVGDVSYEKIMPLLRKYGYSGDLVAEIMQPLKRNPEFLYEITSRALDIIMSY